MPDDHPEKVPSPIRLPVSYAYAGRPVCVLYRLVYWSRQPYVSASDEETTLYDAQLVVLLMASGTAEEAQRSMNEWLDLAANNYTVTGKVQQTYNNQEFTVLTYAFPSDAT